MSQNEFLAGRKLAKEAEYFHKKEQELIAKMRQRAALAAERGEMGEALGIADEEILQDLQELGFNRETVKLLHLIPLIQVAWADGQVTSKQLAKVLEIAREGGIAPEGAAFQQLLEWINNRPSEAFFQNSLRVIQAMLEGLSPEEQANSKTSLVSYCTSVAAASGGLLGFGRKISAAERSHIEQIAGELEDSNKDAVRQMLEGE